MDYLLDSCILIDLLRGKTVFQDRIMEIGRDRFCVCDIVLAELFVGPFKRNTPLAHRQVEWVERSFDCFSFGKSYRTYARLRASLEQKGKKLDNMDLLIASVAIDNDLTLVTHNAKHFSRIPGLKVEVWE